MTEHFVVALPAYIVTIEGFTCPDTPDSNKIIAAAISAKLIQ